MLNSATADGRSADLIVGAGKWGIKGQVGVQCRARRDLQAISGGEGGGRKKRSLQMKRREEKQPPHSTMSLLS